MITAGLMALILVAGFGCGQDLPFEYRYLSANKVQVKYLEKIWELDRYGTKLNAPFDYEFESDGDLDITVAGKTYEIESPYDIDKPKKKTTTRKKRTSAKRTRK